MSRVFQCGRPADAATLAALALVNYGHFTSMQVRGGAVQGLDLHLERLQHGTTALFGHRLDEVRLRAELVAALQAHGHDDASMRVTVFAPDFDFRDPLRAVQPEVLVALAPPAPLPATALRLRPVAFVRELPQVKHVGTFALFLHRREAMADGFDDALLLTADGHLVEGTVWNLGLWDGQGVTWPQGPALPGTRQRLLQAGLERFGVPQRTRAVYLDELAGFQAAFACNARGLQPVRSVGSQVLAEAVLPPVLEQALAVQPWQPLRA